LPPERMRPFMPLLRPRPSIQPVTRNDLAIENDNL
jgi:hypothetical protein